MDPQELREFCLSAPGAGICAISAMQVEERFLGKWKSTRHMKKKGFLQELLGSQESFAGEKTAYINGREKHKSILLFLFL